MLQLQILFLIIFCLGQVIQSLESNGSIGINSIFNSNGKHENFKLLSDAFLLTPELIQKYGYKAQKHTVQTEDGYLLEMHRIPKEGGKPVFLMHGLLDSSATWVLMGPGKGLAYVLADMGYDVWMGNARGNRYSRRHVSLNLSSSKFWDFSFHEIGKYDLPAMIDYVLQKTKHEKLHYIGHSQGTITFWIMCSEFPEYNNKILSMQALGPVAYLSHNKSPIVKILKPFIGSLNKLFKLIGLNEFLPNSDLWAMFGQEFCRDGNFVQIICMNSMFMLAGYNPKQTNTTMLPVIMGHIPAGSSSKQIVHFIQLANSGKFRQYDHGWLENLGKYEQIAPPEYNLSKVKAKVVLHYSPNDWMAQPEDIEKLYEKLPNKIGKFLVEDQEFNHVDFVWGIAAKELVYKKIIKIMNLVENGKI